MPPPTEAPRTPRTRIEWLVVALVTLHIGWGALRVPTKVWGKRLDEIQRYRADGAPRFFLDTEHLSGAAAIERLLSETPEDVAVLWRGDWKGPMEFAAALLAPRLLLHEIVQPPGAAAAHGRRFATLPDEQGNSRVIVLEGTRTDLEIEYR